MHTSHSFNVDSKHLRRAKKHPKEIPISESRSPTVTEQIPGTHSSPRPAISVYTEAFLRSVSASNSQGTLMLLPYYDASIPHWEHTDRTAHTSHEIHRLTSLAGYVCAKVPKWNVSRVETNMIATLTSYRLARKGPCTLSR